MSGICGIVFAPGRNVAERDVACILEPLARRGPDGSHIALSGRAGLGHALLATMPEAQAATQPLRHTPSGCIITADARLDQRDELAERLGVRAQGKSDAEIIVLAYLAAGAQCLEHLRGDFAFAIWDPREDALLCARDQVGMRQLIYTHTPGAMFAFATEAEALLRHPAVPCDLDEGRIADALEDLEAHDLDATLFRHLKRLPPAHALRLGPEGLKCWRYWQVEPPEPLLLGSDAAYAEAFLAVFTEAVRSRLRAAGPVGSMLSGGVDSGGVSAVAAHLLEQSGAPPLTTFSAIRDQRDCVESNAIRAALAIRHIDPVLMRVEEFEGLRDDLEALTRETGEPFDRYMVMLRALYRSAQRRGIKVMLDGGGGDMVLASEPMVLWHWRNARPARALREALGERRFWGEGAEPFAKQARDAARLLLPPAWRAQRHKRFLDQRRQAAARDTILDPDFATRIDIAARHAQYAEHVAVNAADPRARRVQRMQPPHLVLGRERYDRIASACAIEARDPFLDLRVIALCMALPQEQLQDGGWPKIALRRALRGLLPDPVIWRVGKEHLGWRFTEALHGGDGGQPGAADRARLEPFVAPAALAEMANASADEDAIEQRYKLLELSRWLDRIAAIIAARLSGFERAGFERAGFERADNGADPGPRAPSGDS